MSINIKLHNPIEKCWGAEFRQAMATLHAMGDTWGARRKGIIRKRWTPEGLEREKVDTQELIDLGRDLEGEACEWGDSLKEASIAYLECLENTSERETYWKCKDHPSWDNIVTLHIKGYGLLHQKAPRPRKGQHLFMQPTGLFVYVDD